MNIQAPIYRPELVDACEFSVDELRGRWTEEKIGRLRYAISSGASLPRIFPPLILRYANHTIEVEDIRGASLNQMNIPDYDLAYCALDYANFDHSRLTKTLLQYSSLQDASFRSATLDRVQASPVNAARADFSFARIRHCYFSHSNLDQVLISNIEVEASDFVEASQELKTSSLNTISNRNDRKFSAKVFEDFNPSGKKYVLTRAFVRVGDPKIGTVLPSKRAGYVMVSVSNQKMIKSSGKVIDRKAVYKIIGSEVAFTVGDQVKIHPVEIDESIACKIFKKYFSKKIKNISRDMKKINLSG